MPDKLELRDVLSLLSRSAKAVSQVGLADAEES